MDSILYQSPRIEPECDPEPVAAGDLSELSEPYLIACACPLQRDEFVRLRGLYSWQVRSIAGAGSLLGRVREDKILLLLPDWECCRKTARMVSWWRQSGRTAVPLPAPSHDDLTASTQHCGAALAWLLAAFVAGTVAGLWVGAMMVG